MTAAPSVRVWSIIPARGGSKGIPGKNLKKIQGRSLVFRAVAAAREARCVERVFVSTDDSEIAAEAKRAGAEVIDRPAHLAGDTASSESALLDALDRLAEGGEILPDIVVFQQCTSPFVAPADIDGTVSQLLRQGADTAFTAIATHGFVWREDQNGNAVGVNHDQNLRQRRQDRAPEYLETGAVYAMRTAGFREFGHRFFGKTVLFQSHPARAIEIDAPEDLAAARACASFVDCPASANRVPTPLGGVVFDFDGVMTDDRVTVSQDGSESVRCSRSDGMGLSFLKQRNIRVAVISREKNPVVIQRCAKLDIEAIVGCEDKLTALRGLCTRWGCSLAETIFVGNDLPDIDCLDAVGFGVVVADAHPQAKLHADLVLMRPGGSGAVRELCDIILSTLRERP